MQEIAKDPVASISFSNNDTITQNHPVYVEMKSSEGSESINFYSKNHNNTAIPDWYLLLVFIVLSLFAAARIFFGKFINTVWLSAYSYQIASKTFKEKGILQRRLGLALDFLYLINASLFIYLLNRYFKPGIIQAEGPEVIIISFSILFLLILVRIFMMRLIAHIFKRSDLFQAFLFHYFIYSKVLAMLLIPFIFAIPYTTGNLQETLIFTAISAVLLVQIFRLYRAIIFVVKNVVLIFYLILYLCTLEILPVLVIIKLVLSMAQVQKST